MLKRSFLLVFCLIFFVGCKKDPSLWQIENLNENTISVFGHGGMGISYRYPMNSKTSLLDCLNTGAAGTEMDVYVSKDSVMVLYHNQDLEDLSNCSGRIKEKNWNEIEGCEYKLPLLSPEPIIRADDFFASINKLNQFLYVFDCKIAVEDNEAYLHLFANALLTHIQKYDLYAKCFIECTNVSFLEILKSKNANLRLCLYTSDFNKGLEAAKRIGLYGLTLDTEKISKEEVQVAHENKIRIALFNLTNEQENLKAIEKSPDFLQTDKVEYLLNALKE